MLIGAIGKASTFKALECREGDERDSKWDTGKIRYALPIDRL